MNEKLDLRLDKNEFLRWVEGQKGRYELKGGRVVMMTAGSRRLPNASASAIVAFA